MPTANVDSTESENMPKFQRHGPDSLHSWLTAGACALATFFGMAARRSSGFLYVAIMDTFNASRSQAAWPTILLGGVVLLTGLVAGPLAHRYTARPVAIAGGLIGGLGLITSFFAANAEHLIVTLGIIHPIGSGMLFIAIPTIINEHFLRYKGLAMGVNFAGAAMGTFVFPKFLELATNEYGFKGALLLFGALCLNAVAFSLFLRQPSWLNKRLEQEREARAGNLLSQNETGGSTSSEDTVLLKNSLGDRASVKGKRFVHGSFRYGLTVFSCPAFYLVMYSYIAFSFAFECYISLLIDFAIDRGIPVSQAVNVLSASSVACLIGRLTLPALADRGYITRQGLMAISFAWIGSLYILLPFAKCYAVVFAMATGIAFCIGTPVVLFSVLLAEYVGLDRVSMAYGMVCAATGMTALVKPLVIGYFRDKACSYDNLFRLCGSGLTFGAGIWICLQIWRSVKKKEKWTPQNDGLSGSPNPPSAGNLSEAYCRD